MRIRSACLLYVLTLAAGCGGGDEDPPPLDTVPDTRFESAPGAGLNSAEESAFTLACDQPTCTFECSLDDAAYAPCDATLVLDHLSAGDHTIEQFAKPCSPAVFATRPRSSTKSRDGGDR